MNIVLVKQEIPEILLGLTFYRRLIHWLILTTEELTTNLFTDASRVSLV